MSPCDLTHMFALCPKLQTYWNSVFKISSSVLGIILQPCPLTTIFGVPSDPSLLTPKQADVITFTTLLARRRILLKWKSVQPSSTSDRLTDVMYFLKLEKIKHSLRGSSDKFITKWRLFISFFNALQRLPSD